MLYNSSEKKKQTWSNTVSVVYRETDNFHAVNDVRSLYRFKFPASGAVQSLEKTS